MAVLHPHTFSIKPPRASASSEASWQTAGKPATNTGACRADSTCLNDDSPEPPLKLFDSTTESEEVDVKLLCIHIHGVIAKVLELFSRRLEVAKDLLDAGRQRLALQCSHLWVRH